MPDQARGQLLAGSDIPELQDAEIVDGDDFLSVARDGRGGNGPRKLAHFAVFVQVPNEHARGLHLVTFKTNGDGLPRRLQDRLLAVGREEERVEAAELLRRGRAELFARERVPALDAMPRGGEDSPVGREAGRLMPGDVDSEAILHDAGRPIEAGYFGDAAVDGGDGRQRFAVRVELESGDVVGAEVAEAAHDVSVGELTQL